MHLRVEKDVVQILDQGLSDLIGESSWLPRQQRSPIGARYTVLFLPISHPPFACIPSSSFSPQSRCKLSLLRLSLPVVPHSKGWSKDNSSRTLQEGSLSEEDIWP